MSGIAAYIGADSAKQNIIMSLKSLECRGYDSSGLAIVRKGKLILRKESGKVENLTKRITKDDFDGQIGIGHTRWATHGTAIRENAHPHLSMDGRIAVVHNGIFDNYLGIKERLEKRNGIEFRSDTDSEVFAHLISVYYEDDILEAVFKAASELKGTFSAAVIAEDNEDQIIAVNRGALMFVGLGPDCNYLASDTAALIPHTKEIYKLQDDIAVVSKDDIRIYDSEMTRVNRERLQIEQEAVEPADKDGYDHFLRKEIFEQAETVRGFLGTHVGPKGRVKLDEISLSEKDLKKINKIYITACGSSWHAALLGKILLERYAGIPAEAILSSEFRYCTPVMDKNTLVICISQSGETVDTLEALRKAKTAEAKLISICNSRGSSIEREEVDIINTDAGSEMAVASTKAYLNQLICLYLLAINIGSIRGNLTAEDHKRLIKELKALPEKIEETLKTERQIIKLAEQFYIKEQIFYTGRGLDLATAHEGSQKLKEISYINSIPVAAGELKHGTIALINKGTLFLALATQDCLYEKMLLNIREIKARQACVISIAKKGRKRIKKISDECICLPDHADEVSPVLAVIPLQLLAYHMAKLRKRDIDMPRNLAKSVAVE